jgi:magnesium-transporting ATPase (P-type)
LQQHYKQTKANQVQLDSMNKIIETVVVFFAICLALLGAIFLIAGGTESILIGAVLLVIALLGFYFVYRTEKIEATKPTLVSQTFNVKMEGSGQMATKEMKCRSGGAPITEKDLTVIQGGIMAKCSFCGAVFAMEDAPKW